MRPTVGIYGYSRYIRTVGPKISEVGKNFEKYPRMSDFRLKFNNLIVEIKRSTIEINPYRVSKVRNEKVSYYSIY